jgi:hypothetical protein
MVIGVLGIVCLGACAKTVDQPAGTNTNWLQSCDSDADCSDGASCLCDVCTVPCEETTQCGEIASTRCEPLDELSCGGASAAAAACLTACDGDDECGDVEDGRCVSGVCARTSVSPQDAGNASGCAVGRPEVDCACPDQGDQVCTEGDTTFICATQSGAAKTTWTALAEGLCSEPNPGTCPPAYRKTLPECLADADACYLQESGGYCGFAIEQGGSNPLAFALTRQGAGIQITDVYRECEAHADCELVGTACNGCCNESAIHRGLIDAYTANMATACADYEGAVCDCSFEDLVPRCVDDRCAAIPRENIVECYSHALPEGAYDADAVGCNCDDYAMKSICTGRYALMCQPSRDSKYAWIAVEDGPCGEPEPDLSCTAGEVRPTPTACLDDFEWCWQLENGEYCGVTNP